jgi:hypothetical protein
VAASARRGRPRDRCTAIFAATSAIAFFDTHWFLRERHPAQRASFFERLKKTLDGARDREVILMPIIPTAPPALTAPSCPGYHTLGIAYVMKKAGALIQESEFSTLRRSAGRPSRHF